MGKCPPRAGKYPLRVGKRYCFGNCSISWNVIYLQSIICGWNSAYLQNISWNTAYLQSSWNVVYLQSSWNIAYLQSRWNGNLQSISWNVVYLQSSWNVVYLPPKYYWSLIHSLFQIHFYLWPAKDHSLSVTASHRVGQTYPWPTKISLLSFVMTEISVPFDILAEMPLSSMLIISISRGTVWCILLCHFRRGGVL